MPVFLTEGVSYTDTCMMLYSVSRLSLLCVVIVFTYLWYAGYPRELMSCLQTIAQIAIDIELVHST